MYIVGCNMPGYLPDCDPYEIDTFEEAKRALIEDIKSLEDSAATEEIILWTEEEAEILCEVAEEVNLWSGPNRTVTLPGGYTYWIAEE